MKLAIRISIATAMIVVSFWCGKNLYWRNSHERAAFLLSRQFETVLYSRPQFASAWDEYNPLPKDAAASLRYPFSYLWEALDALPKPAANALLANSDGVLLGAKEFQAPIGLGAVRSTRCYVVVLKDKSSFRLPEYAGTESMNSASGLQIWHWSAILGEFGDGTPFNYEVPFRQSDLYAAIVKSKYLLVSNSKAELEIFADRLTSTNGYLASSWSSTNWHAMLNHDMSGYRKYRQVQLNPMAEGTQDVPPAAESLTFFVDAEKKAITLDMFSKDPMSKAEIAKFAARDNMPSLVQRDTHTWESTIALSNDQKTWERSFMAMCDFGFVVYM